MQDYYDKKISPLTKKLMDIQNDSITLNLNEIALDMFDFMEEHGRCNSFEPEDKCLNPNCKGFFAHSQVGLRGGDLPEGFTE